MKHFTFLMLISSAFAQSNSTDSSTPAPPPPPLFTTSLCFDCATKSTNKFCSSVPFNLNDPSYEGYCCTPEATGPECTENTSLKCSETPDKSESSYYASCPSNPKVCDHVVMEADQSLKRHSSEKLVNSATVND